MKRLASNTGVVWLTSLVCPISLIAALMLTARAAEPNPEGVEFFEKKIRPVMVDRCYKCHSSQSEKLKAGLHLDSREGMLKGGDTGPAIVPGTPDKSLLIEALGYANPDLQMPPKGKLPDDQIADFTRWIQIGAPWPKESAGKSTAKPAELDIARRKAEHWAWKPVVQPRVPQVSNPAWPATPIDYFLLAKLDAAGLKPAPPADRPAWLRRVYFDLVGLPPSPMEVEKFIADSSSEAAAQAVDHLLASPAFGERWGRHWLDLMRYAETLGHEFDYPLPNAWQYRDYVIRAFNADLPYDQFVLEQIAGDLLPKPRWHPTERFNESLIGPAFFWLTQQTHSPVDVRMHQAEVIDNQIDVLSKTFLGLTVACARCHDHKFDAISTRDFYSLYGVISSSRYAQRMLDQETRRASIRDLRALKKEIVKSLGHVWNAEARSIEKYLLAAHRVLQQSPDASAEAVKQGIEQMAAEQKLAPERLTHWVSALKDKAASNPAHPLALWHHLAQTGSTNGPIVTAWQTFFQSRPTDPATPASKESLVFFDVHESGSEFWFNDGEAFQLAAAGDVIVGDSAKPCSAILPERTWNSAAVSHRLQGALRSPTFTIAQRYAHLLVAGQESRVNVFIDNFALIQDPIYGGLRRVLQKEQLHWLTIDLEMWKGHRAYIEISDMTTPDLAGGGKSGGYNPNGWAAISRIVFSDSNSAPASDAIEWFRLFDPQSAVTSLEELAQRYGRVTQKSVQAWGRCSELELNKAGAEKQGPPASIDSPALVFLDRLTRFGLIGLSTSNKASSWAALLEQWEAMEKSLPEPIRTPSMADGNGLDEQVFKRGNPRNPGEPVPRRFLEALSGPDAKPFAQGSGRLELAQHILDPSNPFITRVYVNRVWSHMFGRGIVPTPDDFGVLGQPPSHPELLDWLAHWFRTEGQWSTKRLIRMLALSTAYRMSSQPADRLAEDKDPENILWHRMPVRRLEGEAIRDAILALSGRLDRRMFGPSVATHLTPFMDGRGKPGSSGPLDGAGRRSIYLEVRRNFLPPMMRTFDTPVPFTTVGKRTVSNVPAQSLILMNDPFVLEQATLWARRIQPLSTPQERIERLYLEAFSRPPSAIEMKEALAFLTRQAAAYGGDGLHPAQNEQVWADLCHVLWNVKEFVFLN